MLDRSGVSVFIASWERIMQSDFLVACRWRAVDGSARSRVHSVPCFELVNPAGGLVLNTYYVTIHTGACFGGMRRCML